jgi:hypothetical protein
MLEDLKELEVKASGLDQEIRKTMETRGGI